MTGRVPGSPRTPGSGRKRGSINRAERAELTDRMAKDLLTVYQRLGGVKWLLQFAKDQPAEFLRQGLSRLFPAPQKDDPDIQINQQFNGIDGDPIELARRVAFSLAKAANALGQDAEVVADRVPYVSLAREDPSPQELLRVDQPDPAREAWAETVALSQEERLNRESLEEHVNRRAFAAPRPEWMDQPKPAGRPFVGHPRRGDLL